MLTKIRDRNLNTKEIWDRFYKEMPMPVMKKRLSFYEAACSYITKPKSSVVDIGCGSGYGMYYLIQHNSYIENIHGFDISSTACDISRMQGIHAYCLDITKQDISSLKTDYITLLETLEHLDNPMEVVDKCLECCGSLIITVPYKEACKKEELHVYTGFDEDTFKDYDVLWTEIIRNRRNILFVLKGKYYE